MGFFFVSAWKPKTLNFRLTWLFPQLFHSANEPKNQLVAQPCFDGSFLTWLVSGRVNSIMVPRVIYYQTQIKVLKLNTLTCKENPYFRLILSEVSCLCVCDRTPWIVCNLFFFSPLLDASKRSNTYQTIIPSPH